MTNQEAISILKNISIDYGEVTLNQMEEIDEAMDMAIEALEHRWIPCSERLPEHNGNYLVQVESSDGTAALTYMTVDHYGPDWLHNDKMHKAVAWMPLPEPYEERRVYG